MSEELKPCPCGGKMELLNDQRHMRQRASRERFELVCAECGLTVKHPSKSTHKLMSLWNTRSADTELVEALEKIVEEITACGDVNEADSVDEAIYKLATEALAKYKENE